MEVRRFLTSILVVLSAGILSGAARMALSAPSAAALCSNDGGICQEVVEESQAGTTWHAVGEVGFGNVMEQMKKRLAPCALGDLADEDDALSMRVDPSGERRQVHVACVWRPNGGLYNVYFSSVRANDSGGAYPAWLEYVREQMRKRLAPSWIELVAWASALLVLVLFVVLSRAVDDKSEERANYEYATGASAEVAQRGSSSSGSFCDTD